MTSNDNDYWFNTELAVNCENSRKGGQRKRENAIKSGVSTVAAKEH